MDVDGDEEGTKAAPEEVQLLQEEGASRLAEGPSICGAPGLPDCSKEDQVVFDQDLLEAIEQVLSVWEQAAQHSDPATFRVHVWLAMLGLTGAPLPLPAPSVPSPPAVKAGEGGESNTPLFLLFAPSSMG